jgi:hypothetical protein
MALVGLREYWDTSFKSEEEVARILNLPVLALVPVLIQEHERRTLHRKSIVGSALAVIVVLVSSAAAFALWKMQ